MIKSHWIKVPKTFVETEASFPTNTIVSPLEAQSIFAFITGHIDSLKVNDRVLKSSLPGPIKVGDFLLREVDAFIVEYCENDLREWCKLNNAEYLISDQVITFIAENRPAAIKEDFPIPVIEEPTEQLSPEDMR